MELDELQEKFFALRERRIELFGEALKTIRSELEQHDLKDVPTEKLFLLLLKYSDALKSESSETVFSSVENSTAQGFFEFNHTSSWRA